jgi:hypothetical protein
MPGILCLLGGKTQKIYDHVLDVLLNMAAGLGKVVKWKKCLCDFEVAIRNTMQSKVDGVQILGCFFHFTKNIYAHIKADKLLNEMYAIKKSILKSLVRDIMSLAFIPKHVIQATYTKVISLYKEKFPNFFEVHAVSTFLTYFEKQWMRESILESWNLFDRDGYRTNNHLEGFHWFLQREIGVHPTFWLFVDTTKVLYAKLQREFESYRDNGNVSSCLRRLKARTKDENLLRLKDAYVIGEASVERSVHYLQRIRRLNCQAELQLRQANSDDEKEDDCSNITQPSISDPELEQHCTMEEGEFLYTFEGYAQALSTVQRRLLPADISSTHVQSPTRATALSNEKPTLAAGRFLTFVHRAPFAPCAYLYGKVVSIEDKVTVVETGDGEQYYLQSYESVCCDVNLSHIGSTDHAEFHESSIKLSSYTLQDGILPGDDVAELDEDHTPNTVEERANNAVTEDVAKFVWTVEAWELLLQLLQDLHPANRPWHNPRWKDKISKSNDCVAKFRDRIIQYNYHGHKGKIFRGVNLNELKKKCIISYKIATERFYHGASTYMFSFYKHPDGYHTPDLQERFGLQKDLSISAKSYKRYAEYDDEYEGKVRRSFAHMFLNIGRKEYDFDNSGGMAAHCVPDVEQRDGSEDEEDDEEFIKNLRKACTNVCTSAPH